MHPRVPQADNKEIFSPKQAMVYLNITLDRLNQEINAGRLGYFGNKGSGRRFHRMELDRWRRETKRAKRAMPKPPDLTGVPRQQRQLVASVLKIKQKARTKANTPSQ